MITEMTLGEVVTISAVVVFFVRMLWVLERLLTMHIKPDEYGFGTEQTNKLLLKQITSDDKKHDAIVHVIQRLDTTIDRLGVFIEKWIEIQTGQPVVPPRKP